jgi:uncharacterized protein YaaN involved in tellurite resistance
MKKIFILILTLIISVSGFSQTIPAPQDSLIKSLPAYYMQGNDTLGVIISIDQAQKIDNDLELLQLFEDMRVSCDSVVKHYIVVVNQYERKIAVVEAKFNKSDSTVKDQKLIINNLNKKIDNYEADLKLAQKQLKMKDDIIANNEKMIGKLQLTKGIGLTGTVVGFGLFILHVATHK